MPNNRRYLALLLSVIALVLLNVILVNQLATQTLKSQLNCDTLIDRPLSLKEISLCKGLSTTPIGPFEILRPFELGTFKIPGKSIPAWTLPILPGLANTINPLLADLRSFLVWASILFLALTSLFLTVIWNKVTTFIREMQTPEGFKTALTNLSIWLFFFVSFCGLFYSQVVIVP